MTKRLFLTGRPGIGKTTVVKKVLEKLADKAVGFYTQEIRENGERTGFEIITTWGERFPLAHITIKGLKVSKYGVDVKALDMLISKFDSLRTGKILVIDEIGKMELLSHKFKRWIEHVLSSEQNILATIPIKSTERLIKNIKIHYPVWEVTKENRDHLIYRVIDFFLSPCPQPNPPYMPCNNNRIGKGAYRIY